MAFLAMSSVVVASLIVWRATLLRVSGERDRLADLQTPPSLTPKPGGSPNKPSGPRLMLSGTSQVTSVTGSAVLDLKPEDKRRPSAAALARAGGGSAARARLSPAAAPSDNRTASHRPARPSLNTAVERRKPEPRRQAVRWLKNDGGSLEFYTKPSLDLGGRGAKRK